MFSHFPLTPTTFLLSSFLPENNFSFQLKLCSDKTLLSSFCIWFCAALRIVTLSKLSLFGCIFPRGFSLSG